MGSTSHRTRHRAMYMMEFGVWRAKCRCCGYTVTDPSRRQAASQFRNHIRDADAIDLREKADQQLVATVQILEAEASIYR